MTATQLLRNAREKLLDFCMSIPSSDPRSVALLEFVLEIDALLSQPEPTMSAEQIPSDGLLMSIAMRLDHAAGMPGYYDNPLLAGKPGDHARRLQSLLADARRAWEEVVGKGFWSAERNADYEAMRAAALDLSRKEKAK